MLNQKIQVFVLLLSGWSFIGCGSRQVPTPPLPPSGVWMQTVSFDNEEGRTPIVTSHVWMGNEVLFLLVPDFKQAGGNGGRGESDEARFHGGMYLPDGKTQITFQAETIKGEIESVVIADKSYDLKDGRLFFLSSKEGLGVKQLAHDTRILTAKPKDSREIEAFLRNVPEFQKFLPPAG